MSSKRYAAHFSPLKTSQSRPIPGREAEMVQNLAKGYAFEVGDWLRLERFLILGSAGGTYYVGERELTIANAQCVRRCLKEDPTRAIDLIAQIATSGRAAKITPSLFALAIAATPKFTANLSTRQYALVQLNIVCKTASQLQSFVAIITKFGGWRRSLRTAVSNWYTSKTPRNLAYQVAKYQRREGWANMDLHRMAHPKPPTRHHGEIFKWIAGDGLDIDLLQLEIENSVFNPIIGLEYAKRATTAEEIVGLIQRYRLTREMIPTNWFNTTEVWEAMLEGMPMFAMLRNLGKMTQVGLLAPMTDATNHVIARLTNPEAITGSGLHPWNILNAAYWYRLGHGMLGKLTWTPTQTIASALHEAFYLSFGNVVPSGKRVCICLDASGSMAFDSALVTIGRDRRGNVVKGMTAIEAAAAMALITTKTETNNMILLFDTKAGPANIYGDSSLDDIAKNMRAVIGSGYMPQRTTYGGGTDYAAPINYMRQERIPVDAFIIYGDEESWAGAQHACQAMAAYRTELGLPTKLAVVNFCATGTSIVDPKDPLALNFAGFDTIVPRLVADFVRE